MFYSMQRQGVVPNAITYSALTSAGEKGQRLKQAMGMLYATQRQGVVPTTITYSSLISACKKGQRL